MLHGAAMPMSSSWTSSAGFAQWPDDHVLGTAVRLSQLGVARFTKKYTGVLDAMLRTMLEVVVKYQRAITG